MRTESRLTGHGDDLLSSVPIRPRPDDPADDNDQEVSRRTQEPTKFSEDVRTLWSQRSVFGLAPHVAQGLSGGKKKQEQRKKRYFFLWKFQTWLVSDYGCEEGFVFFLVHPIRYNFEPNFSIQDVQSTLGWELS